MWWFHFTDLNLVYEWNSSVSDSLLANSPDLLMIIISDCVVRSASRETIKIWSEEASKILSHAWSEAKVLCVYCMTVKKLFFNLISKYLKCTVKKFFLADCFLLYRGKKSSSSIIFNSSVSRFVSPSVSLACIRLEEYIASFLSWLDSCSFSEYYPKTDGSPLYPNFSGYVMDIE